MLSRLHRFIVGRQQATVTKGIAIYIDGNVYRRSGSGISVVTPGNVHNIVDRNHVAPNGVTITKIAYCLALADGLAPFPSMVRNGR